MTTEDKLPCWVYRASRKDETYIFLVKEDAGASLPEGLAAILGPLEFVMQLDLHPGRKLARADVTTVMSDLESKGFYLQLPPSEADGTMRH